MLRFAISLRFIMLIASLGSALGAMLMFWEGASKIVGAANSMVTDHDSKTVIAAVMGGTDAFLFGIVLVVFAYGIAFGFVFDLPPGRRESLPIWMQVKGVGELKDTLVQVILVYLVIDFATDWPEFNAGQSWAVLAKPISIFLIAAAFRLFASAHPKPERAH